MGYLSLCNNNAILIDQFSSGQSSPQKEEVKQNDGKQYLLYQKVYTLSNNIQDFVAYHKNKISNIVFLELKLPHDYQHSNNVDKFSATHY